jgi:hypothetical protein
MKRFSPIALFSTSLLALVVGSPISGATHVTTLKLPVPGFRPQAVVDGEGTLHLVYADVEHRGDLFYIKRKAGQKAFSKPVKVNSTPNCAAAFNMAVGKKGRVHVLIRPNAKYSKNILKRPLKFYDLKYMLYCRLDDSGTAFEKERDLSASTFGFEGVGAIITDGKGVVRVFWHGLAEAGPEPTRQVFMVMSHDEGRTFSAVKPIHNDVTGACACCSMQGTMDAKGRLYLAFRNAKDNGNKDSYLLTSRDGGKTFSGTLLDRWEKAGCPGSTYSLARGASGMLVAWDTKGQVFFASAGDDPKGIAAPTGGKKSRSPLVVGNSKGETLFVWSEAANVRQFQKGGDLAWQVYDKDGRPVGKKGMLRSAVLRWSIPAAYATPDGDFVILHDGPGGAE